LKISRVGFQDCSLGGRVRAGRNGSTTPRCAYSIITIRDQFSAEAIGKVIRGKSITRISRRAWKAITPEDGFVMRGEA
jgi:hypothetical protein